MTKHLVTALAALLASETATADQLVDHGHEVFQTWCAPCHAPGPHHPGTQALAVKYKNAEPPALEDRRDLSTDVTRYYVRQGVSVMPPFRKTEVTDDDLAALAAYLARAR